MINVLYLGTRELPGGELSYLVRDGVVIGASFRGPGDVLDRVDMVDDERASIRQAPRRDEVGKALGQYARGDLSALDRIEVAQPGAAFRQRVWSVMRSIPPGTADTYAALAARAGSPRAYRAAGTACSTNLVAPFVPCHRVVASNGLGGYGYGLDVKIALLEHEGYACR